MKTLSLSQPWATLVAIGAKKIETRSWPTRHRGSVAIHAAKNFPADVRDFVTDAPAAQPFRNALERAGIPTIRHLPLGAIIAVGNLHHVGKIRLSDTGKVFVDGKDWYVQGAELEFGDYTPGRWAWVLTNVHPLKEPVPARGSLGLWDWQPPADLVLPEWARSARR